MSTAPVPLVLQAIEALKAGDRRVGARLLAQDLASGSPSPDRCRTISRLAAEIGEIDLAVDALRRSLAPPTLDRLLAFWGTLASYGRADEVFAEMKRLPADIRNHYAVLHLEGTLAGEEGRFEEAEEILRRALLATPDPSPTWFALSMVKTFTPGDPDIGAMEQLLQRAQPGSAGSSRLHYALGKAYEDCGDFDRAFHHFEYGAEIRRQAEPYDAASASAAADRVIRDFTPENLQRLTPSQMRKQRSLFVTGLPRSGTTLVQQILAAHSKVTGGGDEVNLFRPALIPTLDQSLTGALAYQQRSSSNDPWGEIGQDYAHFIDMRFPAAGLVVDKSLGQSHLIGLMLHSLPEAKIVWLRRKAEDAALSCFKTAFTGPIHWSWSVEDIAAHFRTEDRLFAHWRDTYHDRILVVSYEELVNDAGSWIGKIGNHLGLAIEPGMERFHESDQRVRTASVKQVRSPVTAARVGSAETYPEFTRRFRAAYEA